MNINDYMERLSGISDIAKTLGREINGDVRVFFFDKGQFWGIRIFDEDGDECRYSQDCESVDELAKHLDTMLVGAWLANGKGV